MIIKSPMNALHNVTNPYQGKDKRVLCLCSAGILRSPSCAVVLNSKYGYNTRAAGVTDYALIPVSTALLEWADEIAGKNLADEQSFSEAIFTAIKIFKNRNEYQDLIENRLKPRVLAHDNGIDEDLPEENE
jgi:predicted protein tyrosine phosphatase